MHRWLRTNGRLPRAAPLALLVMWGAGALAIGAIVYLQERLDERRQAEVVLAELNALVEEGPTRPYAFGPNGESAAGIRVHLVVDARRFQAHVDRLTELDRDEPEDAERLAEISRAGTRFYAELEEILALVLAQERGQAAERQLRLVRPGGIQSQLREALEERRGDLRAEARQARYLSEAGSALIVLLLLVAFSVALVRSTVAGRRALELARTNRRLLDQSRRDEQRYRDLFENANEPIGIVDLEWTITDVNAAFADALGYERDELVGTKLGAYLTEEGMALSRAYRQRKLDGIEPMSRYEQTFVAADGRHLVFEVSTQMLEEDGEPVAVLGMCRDVTARKEAERRLIEMSELNRHQATHDALTGLPNRLAFQREIERSIATSRVRGPFAVALIDVDRFKQVNDGLGHASGDTLLRELAARLRDALPGPAMVARLGGDEFGVLLHGGIDDRTGWAGAIERIKSAFAAPQVVDGVPVTIEASIGIAIYPTHGADADELLRRADVAMYVAKAARRGHAVYSTAEDPNDADKLALLGELRRALDDGELVLHYQPIVDLESGRTVKVEALLRWLHPTRGVLSPAEFVPLAETTGLIRPLTKHVLEAAFRQCRAWADAGHDVGVSVNLSTRNLVEADLVTGVLRTLAEHRLDAERLTLEITESAVLADPVGTKRLLARLGEHGVRIAIDDFGAGFTSLQHLRDLPVHEIKIDRSFVGRMLTHAHDGAIVRSIVALSHDLDLRVVAEGVEDERTLDALADLGCDLAQGYHLGRPLAAEDVAIRLRGEGLADAGEQAA